MSIQDFLLNDTQEQMSLLDGIKELFIIVGLPSPSGRTPKAADGEGFQRSQTLGQRIMGNMENLFLRNLTKSKSHISDASQSSSPIKVS